MKHPLPQVPVLGLAPVEPFLQVSACSGQIVFGRRKGATPVLQLRVRSLKVGELLPGGVRTSSREAATCVQVLRKTLASDQGFRIILGLYRENGKEHGNYHNGVI